MSGFEQLTLWYLRLNGFFVVPNFILHPGTGVGQRTDADLLAIRLPYSAEYFSEESFPNDPSLGLSEGGARYELLIAEIKQGPCSLNGPWTRPDKQNINYVLGWIGYWPLDRIKMVSQDLYSKGACEDRDYRIRLAAFGSEKSNELPNGVLQMTHLQSISFIQDRFLNFRSVKSDHEQWDPFIRDLWRKILSERAEAPAIISWIKSVPCEKNARDR